MSEPLHQDESSANVGAALTRRLRKLAAVGLYTVCTAAVVFLIKTELRKWFAFEGKPALENTWVFWICLGVALTSGVLGAKAWPKGVNRTPPASE